MSATAQVGATPTPSPILRIRGTAYPVVLPSVRDARLHLAAVIVSLQVLGQTAFDFRLSVAQILLSLGTCAAIELAIAFVRQRVIMWPASALLTGNGVAFVLRVPGTRHGDWWSTRGWWIFVGTAAVAILSKHLIRVRGRHLFNPSNAGLFLCFLILGSSRSEPLDFWWGPMSVWLALAVAIIVCGGLAILSRLGLLVIAVGYWLAFALGIGVLALSGHAMTARWHLGPVTGAYFWWVLVTSPEILVFLFFMITDPKTVPAGFRARLAYAAGIGLLAALLIAPQRTEFASKVAVLGALAIVSIAWPLLQWLRLPRGRWARPGPALAAVLGAAGLVAVAGIPARPDASAAAGPIDETRLPRVTIVPAKGVSSQIGRGTALRMARDLVADLRLEADALARRDARRLAAGDTGARLDQLQGELRAAAGREIDVPRYSVERMRVTLEPRQGQGEPAVVATLTGRLQNQTYVGKPPALTMRDEPIPFTRTFEIVLAKTRYLIVVDRGPGTRAAAVRVR